MNTTPVFIRVARLSDLGDRQGRKVTVGTEEIALWRVGRIVYAINNVCAHQHFSALHQGTLKNLTISCPMHGWTFSLETGREASGNGAVKTYRVKIEGDDVYVEEPQPSW